MGLRAKRSIGVRLTVLGFTLSALLIALPSSAESDADVMLERDQPVRACIPAEKCCRIRSAGKACGNSCIQASKTCHKGRGCACNDSELCTSAPLPE